MYLFKFILFFLLIFILLLNKMSSSKHRYKVQLMNGTITKTPGGNTRSDIKTIRKNGETRYIWKKKSSLAKRNFADWNSAVKKAKANIKRVTPNYFKNKGFNPHSLKKSGRLYKEAAKLYY